MKQLTSESWQEILQECTETLYFLSKTDINILERCLQQPKKTIEEIFNIQIPENFTIKFFEKEGDLFASVQEEKQTYLLSKSTKEPKPSYFNIHIDWNKNHTRNKLG